jgi:hypothetical protein
MYSSTFWFICSVALSVLSDMLWTFFIQSSKVDRLSFIGCSQTECLNWELWWKAHELIEMLYKCLSPHSAVIFLHSFSITFLLRQSVIIRRFIQPSLDSRSTTKSMNIFCQICFNTGKASRSLVSSLFSCCSYSICHNSAECTDIL